MESRGSKKSLAPGFRFHPTDEELVRYYLRRKICGKPLRFDAISVIDIYKVEPWDLPGMSRLKTRDLEWYFFSMLDKKSGNGARTNRATERGYWKTTGKDRPVHHKSQVVGMKKTLVYHNGRAPRGQRTNWVMHEYKLMDQELDKAEIAQDAFVLCRVFQKSGSGPKNGEKYGAPFVEEEWEDSELQIVLKEEATEEVEFGEGIYLDVQDLEQNRGTSTPMDGAPLPLDCYCEENDNNSEETNNSFEDWLQQPVKQEQFDPAIQQNTNENPVRHEFIGEPSQTVNSEDVDYLLNEPLVNATDNLQFTDGAFLEANDLSNPFEVDDPGFDMLEEYLTFFDANDNLQNIGLEPSVMIGTDEHISDQASPPKKIGEVADQHTAPSEELAEQKNNVTSSSKLEPVNFGSDCQYSFMKKASCMLGGIPAPPALASEFPAKDAAFRLNSASASSSSVRVTAGFIQIRNMGVGGNGTDWSLGKHEDYNIILSFGLSQGGDDSASLESLVTFPPGKAISTISRGWFYYLFFWVLLLSVTFKIGSLVCAK